jgi:hypothetical protein
VAMWADVFTNFPRVEFQTLTEAVNRDVVIAEQIHGVGLPGRPLALIRNMAVHEMRDGKIAAWTDCTDPAKRIGAKVAKTARAVSVGCSSRRLSGGLGRIRAGSIRARGPAVGFEAAQQQFPGR